MSFSVEDPRSHLPLSSSAFQILLALAGGDRHGYGISKEVELATYGALQLGPGTLYRTIKQMVIDNWIREVHPSGVEDPRRRYYQLTSRGRSIAIAESQRLAELVRIARSRNLLPTNAIG